MVLTFKHMTTEFDKHCSVQYHYVNCMSIIISMLAHLPDSLVRVSRRVKWRHSTTKKHMLLKPFQTQQVHGSSVNFEVAHWQDLYFATELQACQHVQHKNNEHTLQFFNKAAAILVGNSVIIHKWNPNQKFNIVILSFTCTNWLAIVGSIYISFQSPFHISFMVLAHHESQKHVLLHEHYHVC